MFKNINELRKELMLSKKTDKTKANVLTMLLSETLNIAKSDKNREPTEADIQTAVKRLIKKAEQSISFGVQCADLELNILKTMIPEQMSEEDIKTYVDKFKEIHGSNKGLIMKELKNIPGMNMSVASKLI
jgi:uncharacterized protein YqeY